MVSIEITQKFPEMLQRNLAIQPGHTNFIDLSPTILTSSGISDISPQKRKCFKRGEGNLDFYKEYSFKSCVFECKIK